MDEQTQAEFIAWLSQQLGVESEEELQQQINDMGDEGVKQAFDAFQKEKQTPMNKEGGKLNYLKRLNIFKKGGKIADKGQDGKTAVGITKWAKGEDKADALGGRDDSGDPKLTALKRLKGKGKDGKTAVGITKWVKGKDGKTALNRRHDSGKDEHTALNK